MRLLGFTLAQGLSDGHAAPAGRLSEVVDNIERTARRWSSFKLGRAGRVYVANSELVSKALHFAAFQRLPLELEKRLERVVRGNVRHGCVLEDGRSIFYDVSQPRYEAHPLHGGMGQL